MRLTTSWTQCPCCPAPGNKGESYIVITLDSNSRETHPKTPRRKLTLSLCLCVVNVIASETGAPGRGVACLCGGGAFYNTDLPPAAEGPSPASASRPPQEHWSRARTNVKHPPQTLVTSFSPACSTCQRRSVDETFNRRPGSRRRFGMSPGVSLPVRLFTCVYTECSLCATSDCPEGTAEINF